MHPSRLLVRERDWVDGVLVPLVLRPGVHAPGIQGSSGSRDGADGGKGSSVDSDIDFQLRRVFNDMGLGPARLQAAKEFETTPSARGEQDDSLGDTIGTSLAMTKQGRDGSPTPRAFCVMSLRMWNGRASRDANCSSAGYNAVASRPRGETEYLGVAGYRGFQPRLPHRRAHNDLICAILHVENPSRYITAGRDGIVCIWDETAENKLKYRMSFRSGSEWVADLAYMKLSNKLVVVTVEGSIYFYNFSPIVDIVTVVGRITSQRLSFGTPFCCEYDAMHAEGVVHGTPGASPHHWGVCLAVVCGCSRRYHVTAEGKEVLLLGDDAGRLHQLTFDERDWHACDGRLPNKCHKYEVFRGISCRFTRCHETGWLSKVRFIPDLNAFITASTSGEIRLWDVEKTKMLSQYKHVHGVHNFDWSSSLRTLAFCGGDREVTLWNPYSKKKQATLTGHSAVVVQVCVPASGRAVAVVVHRSSPNGGVAACRWRSMTRITNW